MSNKDVISQIEASLVNPLKTGKVKALYLSRDIFAEFKKSCPSKKANRMIVSLVDLYLSNELQIPDELFADPRIQGNRCNGTPTCLLRFPEETWKTFKKYTFVKDLEVNKVLAALMLTYLTQK